MRLKSPIHHNMVRLRKSFLFVVMFAFGASCSSGAEVCELDKVKEAFASFICSTQGYKYGHCSLEKNSARITGVSAASLTAAYLAIRTVSRDLRRFAEVEAALSDIKKNDNYVSGKIATIAGATGRTVDNPEVINGVQKEAEEAARAKPEVEARRNSLQAARAKLIKKNADKGVDLVTAFQELSSGRNNVFSRYKVPGTDRYAYKFDPKRAVKKSNLLWRLTGKSLSGATALAASGVGAGILAMALVEVPFAVYNSKDNENLAKCKKKYADYTDYLQVEVKTGVFSDSTCKLTSNFQPDIEKFFDLNRESQNSLLESPVFCQKIAEAIDRYKISIPKIKSFSCRKGKESRKSLVVNVEIKDSRGELKTAPVFVETDIFGLASRIRTGYNGFLGSTQDYEVDASFNTTRVQEKPLVRDAQLDLEQVMTKEFYSNRAPGRRVPHTFTEGAPNSVNLLQHRRVREIAFFEQNYSSEIKEMNRVCNSSNRGIAKGNLSGIQQVQFNPNAYRNVQIIPGRPGAYSIDGDN